MNTQLKKGDKITLPNRKNPHTVKEITKNFVELKGPKGQDRCLVKNKSTGRLLDNKTGKPVKVN